MIESYHDYLLAGIESKKVYPIHVSLDDVVKRSIRKQEIKKARRINKYRKVGDPFYIPKF